MPTTIDISELRLGCVLDAPIYHDKNVKLLRKGVTISGNFIRQLRRHGIRKVQVTEGDLAKLRGWSLSINSPPHVVRRMDPKSGIPTAVNQSSESRIDQDKLIRYMKTLSQVGRQKRKIVGPLRVIREAARLAANALHAEYFGFGLTLFNTARMTVFLGAGTLRGEDQKLSRYELELPTNRSLFATSMASGSPLVVENLATDHRFRNESITKMQVTSAVAVPLHRRSFRAGSLAVFYRQAKKFDDHDLSFLETVANIVSVPTQIDVVELNAESTANLEIMANRQYDYHCWQNIAPMDGEQFPLSAAYEKVLCRDISNGGFSFYYPNRPKFTHLAVALGQPPHLKRMKATVVSCCGTELDGEPQALVGCRFAGSFLTS